jgi:hypothetical protein
MRLLESFKSLPEVESYEKSPSLTNALREIIASGGDAAIVSEVKLFIRNYTLSLDYSHSSNTWNSRLSASCDAILVICFRANCTVSPDLRISSLASQKPKSGKRESAEPCTANPFEILVTYDGDHMKSSWALFPTDGPKQLYDTLSSQGFEKAETIVGPFPLDFVLEYFLQAERKVFASNLAGFAAFSDVKCLYDERDFSTGLLEYLHHLADMSKIIHRDRRFTYQTSLKSVVPILNQEKQSIIPNNEDFSVDRVNIKRIY